MDFIKKKFKSMYRTSVVFSIMLCLIGIFLLSKPEVTLHAISYVIGILLIVWGIIPIITFITNKEKESYLEFSFICGVFSCLFGIIIMINPNIIGSIIPFLIGTWMIINGIIKLSYSITLNKESNATISIMISIIILICGLLLIFNPFGGAVVLTKLIGVFTIIYSLLDLIECFTLKRTVKKFNKDIKKNDKIIEAVYEEE